MWRREPRSICERYDWLMLLPVSSFTAPPMLRHGTSQFAEGAFNLAQVADFFAERHISNRHIYIAICNVLSRRGCIAFSMTSGRDLAFGRGGAAAVFSGAPEGTAWVSAAGDRNSGELPLLKWRAIFTRLSGQASCGSAVRSLEVRSGLARGARTPLTAPRSAQLSARDRSGTSRLPDSRPLFRTLLRRRL